MNMLSVQMGIATLNDESLPKYLAELKTCDVQRVFLYGADAIRRENEILYEEPERIEKVIRYFQENGIEVGIWIDVLGHGVALSHATEPENTEKHYTFIEGATGEGNHYGYCPMDEQFTKDFQEGIRRIAMLGPDLIMLDDDFRLNGRPNYYLGCLCDKHLAEYRKRLGEDIRKEDVPELAFTGGKNRYRSIFLELSGETLLNFAKALREAVDSVNPKVRLGVCSGQGNWDLCGTDMIAIAKAMAGKTKPFLRTQGAFYGEEPVHFAVETTRVQMAWCKGSGVETFPEGDTYPRPRYNVPARFLELYHLMLLADGTADGMFKYMFDYNRPFDYERGYAEQHIRNAPLREEVAQLFDGKESVGIRVFTQMHKIENWEFKTPAEDGLIGKLITSYRSPGRKLLTCNSIPTTYGSGEYPTLICGEHARYVSEEDMKHGAILDAVAARILTERGFDVGFLGEDETGFPSGMSGEYFIEAGDMHGFIDQTMLKKIRCNDKAEVLSRFMPDNAPASYRYENGKGERFLVFAFDEFASRPNATAPNRNYFQNYYRQKQLLDGVEYLCGKPLPVSSEKNPLLYFLSAQDETSMAVAMANVFPDEIAEPKIRLNKKYQKIRFVNCSGRLEGDTVYLSRIEPYGFAAFEVE